MSNISYTIFEYNILTNSYREVGYVEAPSSLEAREVFTKKTGWKKRENVKLFAKPPICR